MAEVTERHFLEAGLSPERLEGLAVSRHGYAVRCERSRWWKPVIRCRDAAGVKATERAL